MFPRYTVSQRTTRHDSALRGFRLRVSSLLAGLALAGSLPLTASANTLPGVRTEGAATGSHVTRVFHAVQNQGLQLPPTPADPHIVGRVASATSTPKLNTTMTVDPETIKLGVGNFNGTHADLQMTLSITNPSNQPGPAENVEVEIPERIFFGHSDFRPWFAQSFKTVTGTNGFQCWVSPTHQVYDDGSWLTGPGIELGYAKCTSGTIATGTTATVSVSAEIDGSTLELQDLGLHRETAAISWQNGLGKLTAEGRFRIVRP